MTRFTYGLEFEVTSISPRDAANVITDGGVYCEYISNGIHETNDSWKAVHDGSVAGAEVVSPILTAARLNEVTRVTRVLTTHGARVDSSTGFHVHVGARAFASEGVSQNEVLAQFVLNYYGVHHAIAAMVSNSRLRNRFCRVLDRNRAEQDAEFIRNGSLGSSVGDRYTSLNLESLGRHGTVEVRLHQGTLNSAKAVGWAQFISALIEATKEGHDLTEIDGLNPWTGVDERGRGNASTSECAVLLDWLRDNSFLNPSTTDYLKNRAVALHK